MKESMEKAIEALCESEDDVAGYAIIVSRKSGAVSCTMHGNTYTLIGAMEVAKHKCLSSIKVPSIEERVEE